MLKRLVLPLLAFASLTLAPAANADPFLPTVSKPRNFSEYQKGLGEVRENINSVSCGGFASGTNGQVHGVSVTGNVPVPTVSDDFPGRSILGPLGKPTGGLGTRKEFQYPDSAFGYTSSCNILLDRYQDLDMKMIKKDIVLEDISNPDEPVKVTVKDGTGMVDINPGHWCVRYDRATPAWCRKLYEEAWPALSTAAHALFPEPSRYAYCPAPPPNALWAPTYVNKHFCFDRDGPKSGTTTCAGQECRTHEIPWFYNELARCTWRPVIDASGNVGQVPIVLVGGDEDGVTSSFYRHYEGTVTAPTKTWNVRAECYEYYKEKNRDGSDFDPKTTVTTGEGDGGGKDNDEQCEIVIRSGGEQSPDLPEWPDERAADGRRQKENVPDPHPGKDSDPTRDPRTAPAPWITDRETNLSIIDIEKLRELQRGFDDQSDITGAMGAIIPAKQRASGTTPEHARTDTFDHTDHRDSAAFWEAQQRELLKMTRDPTTRLILPARFLIGLSDDSPLFQYVKGTVSKGSGTVELTLRAGGDDLANVMRTLMETYLLPISEVPVPILIPINTADEIDKLISQWKLWREYPENKPYRQRVDALIGKLKQYRFGLQKNQLLRVALESELTRLYGPVRTFSEKMATWYKENTDKLLQAAGHAKQRQQLKRIWRHIQNGMLQADACLLQWCSNQRYSVPVYSLLDNWWGDQPGRSSRNQNYQPPHDLRSLAYHPPLDQVYDFSSLSLSRSERRIPVLDVIQVTLHLPTPPLAGSQPLPASEYPNIPMVPNPGTILSNFPVPLVNMPSLPVIDVPTMPDLEPAKNILREIRKIIDGTSIDQQRFEEAFEDEENDGIVYDEGPNFPKDRYSMRGTYCRFPPSITLPPDPEEKSGYPRKIIQIENDLRERIAFAFSRWMPERTEDFAGRVARLRQEFPTAKKQPACHEDILCMFLPGQRTTTVKWQLFLPTVTMNFTALADRLKNLTLPENEGKNPYINAPYPLLKRLFYNLPLPIDIDLRPKP